MRNENKNGLGARNAHLGRLVAVRPDLHVHSTCSDGLHTPAELARMACSARLTHIALCDHDSVAGNAALADALAREADGARPVPLCLPGVELSCGSEGQTHLLGYGVRCDDPALLAFLEGARQRRLLRVRRIVARLRELGVAVPDALLPLDDAALVGRAHVARALVRMGVCGTVRQAFARYLAPGKPAYVAQEHPTAAEGARLLRAAGGVPVLAHPMRLGLPENHVVALVEALVAEGLRGVEVYHSSSGRAETRLLLSLTRRLGLLATGGSDYHGDRGSSLRLGDAASGWNDCRADVAALWAACGQSEP